MLNELHDITNKLSLPVLGAARVQPKTAGWDSLLPGSSVFLHKGAPKGWWAEYQTLARGRFRSLLFLAQSRMDPYTWAEAKQILEPIGIDRWSDKLFLKYGIRDALTCGVSQRWLVAYWSRQVLSGVLTQPLRILLIAVAGFAALRLEQVIGEDPRRVGNRPPVTPRELAVLRLVSLGKGTHEIAKLLGIGEETVRSHLKKVQAKLGVCNRAHAAAEAVRRQLIP